MSKLSCEQRLANEQKYNADATNALQRSLDQQNERVVEAMTEIANRDFRAKARLQFRTHPWLGLPDDDWHDDHRCGPDCSYPDTCTPESREAIRATWVAQ